jgi:hypothetical protein
LPRKSGTNVSAASCIPLWLCGRRLQNNVLVTLAVNSSDFTITLKQQQQQQKQQRNCSSRSAAGYSLWQQRSLRWLSLPQGAVQENHGC